MAALLLASALALPVAAQQPPQATPARKPAHWVVRSDENTRLLLDVDARFSPESAGQQGVEGVDENIIDLTPGFEERLRKATEEAVGVLKSRLAAEKDPLVRQDLEILVQAAEDSIQGSLLEEKYQVPYFNLSRLIFYSTRALLDDQIAEQRRPAALVRLRKYTGMAPGHKPLTELATALMRERMKNPALLMPVKSEVERDLGNSGYLVEGVGQLFGRYQIAGYEAPFAKLKEQLAAYDEFLRKEVLPKARTDFRLPPELYAFNLRQYGVDIPPGELVERAHQAFREIRLEMQKIAPEVARLRGWNGATDYRDVIRKLKKDQLIGEAILPHYRERLGRIEDIIRRQKLVTLPERAARIRLASAAESAGLPAPNMRPPRLLGNTGEMGEFILPLNIPAPPGSKEATQRMDDFTHEAASWSLVAHEARPGHEMQFAAIVENGVSSARVIYAFNSTNVEGWGLYSEAIIKPYMSLEGQLCSLQFRLQRAARAFLDPELQMGKVTPQQAHDVLTTEVVLSDAMANQEVERYTFRAPGQATAYFYGYTRLVDLRHELEGKLGAKFDQQKFHDFILAQGLLPPDLLRKAVLEEFVDKDAVKVGN
ncbi:MAG TPA: DUF885 domain-containing protein [Terriglobales bacterium]|nr:DUF885 domain-containing protein [Terriglobales bacterium]